MYLGEGERRRCWGELQVLMLVGVSSIQDERNHVVRPGLHFHGYCGLRGVHSYPVHRKQTNTHRVIKKLAPDCAKCSNKKKLTYCPYLWENPKLSLLQLNVSRPLSPVLPCVLARFSVLSEELYEAATASSKSSGVGSGGGNWMLVRSGREPPVLWTAGFSEVFSCWSGDGNMLQKTGGGRKLVGEDIPNTPS